jgi:ribonuclease HII
MIFGFDEVGRGSLAGPVTVGVTVLPNDIPLHTFRHSTLAAYPAQFRFVRDSKHLTPQKRLMACDLVRESGFEYAVLSASNKLIDTYGISLCLKHLLLLGFNLLKNNAITTVLIDGRVYLPEKLDDELVRELIKENSLSIDTITFPNSSIEIINEDKADDKYLSIALASSLAKVHRDSLMKSYSEQYPVYKWDNNKGYATKEHRAAIAEFPDNNLIRRTFVGNILKQVEQTQ